MTPVSKALPKSQDLAISSACKLNLSFTLHTQDHTSLTISAALFQFVLVSGIM
jgi:hypothetical protein